MGVATFNCPSCGAAIAQDSTQCQYCRSLLQTVACSSCFGLMFLGSRFCPHCGAAANVKSPVAAAPHHCPRCDGVDLTKLSIGGTDLEECLHCGGLWVECAAFKHICADREAQAAAVNLALPPPPPFDPVVRYRKCPECSQLMNRSNYAHRSGVVIDICQRHGIWFDRDELRLIIEFIRAGGLDRARELETENLKQERRRLESEQTISGIGGGGPLILPYGRNYGSTGDLLGGVADVLWWLLR